MSQELRSTTVTTSLGAVWFGGEGAALTGAGPVIMIVSGAFRVAANLIPWIHRLADHPVILSNLPSHGGAQMLAETSVKAFTTAYREAIQKAFPGRSILFVGESLAGLVGLGLNLPDVDVLAVDPPLSTAKLWPVERGLKRLFSSYGPELQTFAWNVFGMNAHTVEERDYRGLLCAITRPVSILTGDVPLLPERVAPISPCLLDADDLALLEAHPLVSVHRTRGPHALMEHAPEACEVRIRAMMASLARVRNSATSQVATPGHG